MPKKKEQYSIYVTYKGFGFDSVIHHIAGGELGGSGYGFGTRDLSLCYDSLSKALKAKNNLKKLKGIVPGIRVSSITKLDETKGYWVAVKIPRKRK